MKKKSFKWIAGLAALTAVTLTGCGQNSAEETDGPTEIKVLYNDSNTSSSKSATSFELDYIKEHINELVPDVKVTIETSPGDAQTYETKVRTMLAGGGNDLDVWWERGGSWADPIIKAKNALPLNEYLDKSDYWDGLVSPLMNPKNDDGEIYAIPFEDVSYQIVLYNKQVFSDLNIQPPKTVDELKNIVETLKSNDIIPISVAAKDGWPGAMMLEGFAYSEDPEITKNIVEGKASFTDEPYEKSAETLKDLMDLGAFSKNVALTAYDEAVPLLEVGKAGMLADGSWQLYYLSQEDKMGDNIGYFYYPVIDSKDIDNYGKNIAGGPKKNAGMMVNSETKHPKLAAEVAIAMAELRCKYAYEKTGNPFVVYDAEKLGWKYDGEQAEAVKQLAADVPNFKFTYGFIQDVMPTAAASSSVNLKTSQYFTNSKDYDTETFLKELDQAAKEK